MPKRRTPQAAAANPAIADLQKARGSRVICYVTGDRAPAQVFGTAIAPDVLPVFYEHLKRIGRTGRLSLVLYSNGGSLDAVWPLVSLIREFCEDFEVLVPFRALSAATLMALGANRIVMTPLSQLSPVDPTAGLPVKRPAEHRGPSLAVEDVIGFVDFAKERIGLQEQESLSQVLKALVDEVYPLSLGSTNRAHALIRRLARSLLELHLNRVADQPRVEQIVEHLTHSLFSHSHWINRREARDKVGFGEMIEYASPRDLRLMERAWSHYVRLLHLEEPFRPEKALEGKPQHIVTEPTAVVESDLLCHLFRTRVVLVKSDAEKVAFRKEGGEWLKQSKLPR